MSHLKEQISALIDGELSGTELDRANAHLAACGRCRAEAAELRQLKRELRALAAGPAGTPAEAADRPAADRPGGPGAVRDDEALTRRLLEMAGARPPGGPAPSRRLRRERFRGKRRDQRGGRPGSGPGGRAGPGPWAGSHPHADVQQYYWQAPHAARRRGRYVVWGAVSLVVVGIGAAAFSMGGATTGSGPKIVPQQELPMFSLEHAIDSGDVPLPDPPQSQTARP